MTKPVHIDEAIEVEQVALDYYSNLADMEVAEAGTAGWIGALQAVNSGKVFTGDKLRADRMTRALERSAISYNDFDDGSGGYYRCGACNATSGIRRKPADIPHADDCAWIEARRWVDANPEVVA